MDMTLMKKSMQIAESNYGIKKTHNFKDFDVLIVCVATHRSEDMFSPQTDSLMSVMEKISKESKNGALISIESDNTKRNVQKGF